MTYSVILGAAMWAVVLLFCCAGCDRPVLSPQTVVLEPATVPPKVRLEDGCFVASTQQALPGQPVPERFDGEIHCDHWPNAMFSPFFYAGPTRPVTPPAPPTPVKP